MSILALVHDVAAEFLAAMAAAERLTDQWRDHAAADREVALALDQALERLATSGCWGPENRAPSAELWRLAGHILERGWLQRRAREKPRGYAGDYGLLARICTGYHTADPLGRAFDAYFHRQAAACAVRNRIALMTEQLTQRMRIDFEEPVDQQLTRYVSIGSGPALEVTAALDRWAGAASLEATLLDLDPVALHYAGRRLRGRLPPDRLHLRRENLFRLSHPAKRAAIPAACDLLICIGLFDYLEDDHAVPLLQRFWERLAAGGRMIVGNFAPHCPTRAYMEWGANWYLLYRSRAALLDLAAAAGLPEPRVETEATGVDLFLVVDKPA